MLCQFKKDFELEMKGNKNKQKKHKAQWICEDQVSDTGPLVLLFYSRIQVLRKDKMKRIMEMSLIQ